MDTTKLNNLLNYLKIHSVVYPEEHKKLLIKYNKIYISYTDESYKSNVIKNVTRITNNLDLLFANDNLIGRDDTIRVFNIIADNILVSDFELYTKMVYDCKMTDTIHCHFIKLLLLQIKEECEQLITQCGL